MNEQTFYESLGYYVYLLVDPRDGEIFYVGKGCHARPLDHAFDDKSPEKYARIRAIRESGLDLRIVVLHHHLSHDEALTVECAAIDLLRYTKTALTNIVKGHKSDARGIAEWEELRAKYTQPLADIVEPAVVLRINALWDPDAGEDFLYACTRGWWSLNPENRRPSPRYAFAVSYGIIRQVYEIERWEPAAPLQGREDQWDESYRQQRRQFVGAPAREDLRQRYLNRVVTFKQGSANPVTYVNC